MKVFWILRLSSPSIRVLTKQSFSSRVFRSYYMDYLSVTMTTSTNSKIKKMSPQFLVTDIEHSIEFYTKKLGFNLEFRYEDFYAGIIKDGHSIHLKSGKPSIEERKSKRENDDLDIIFSDTD